MLFALILIHSKEKKQKKLLYNNLGIFSVIIYIIIGLRFLKSIKEYKNCIKVFRINNNMFKSNSLETVKFALLTEAALGLVKLIVMTNVFFNNQLQGIKIKQFIWVKQIKTSFFSNNWNQRFYS